ncbi:MAG: hypothetical protein B9J98_08125 [Candidatus Terraquivivens tikiterensis]|uniref:Uncharacterized protein n=1 Tax=Candidatus Terraquivivens tikiterensis TaxID=1980982 RepID=A0A2R7Y0G0_9ARCH|nr:MAG: hypothetical protein B9J98_08125 [Candidatus Terraquivivens tikiterensis]
MQEVSHKKHMSGRVERASPADLENAERPAEARPNGAAGNPDPVEKAYWLADDLANQLADLADSVTYANVFQTAILRLAERYWGEGDISSIIIYGHDDKGKVKKVIIR